ncbi:hypothetical protein HK104_004276 [Borealophlyctis nickersoniae]|nr:hypothetical protein HK104_004276 [Borealophlyctis nickersoniae]
MSSLQTTLAKTLASLHKPGSPLLLTNVWDPPSTSLALTHPQTKAIATASYAIAAVTGVEDDDLTLEENLEALSKISRQLRKSGKSGTIPLTADLQSGYGDRLEEAVRKVVQLGVVGINLEDSIVGGSESGDMSLRGVDEQVERIKKVIEVAKIHGVDGFVVNARTDCVLLGGTIEEAISRGKRYLDAGATTVFVWGGPRRGLRNEEVQRLVDAFGGRLNVKLGMGMKNALSVDDLARMGVARISVGPGLWREAMAAVGKKMDELLGGSRG